MQHSLDDLILEGINDITNLADGNGDNDESQGAQAIDNAASNIVSQGWLVTCLWYNEGHKVYDAHV